MVKKVSTASGTLAILLATAVIFGGVISYAMLATQKVDGQVQAALNFPVLNLKK